MVVLGGVGERIGAGCLIPPPSFMWVQEGEAAEGGSMADLAALVAFFDDAEESDEKLLQTVEPQ